MSSLVFVAGSYQITSKAIPSDPPCVFCQITELLVAVYTLYPKCTEPKY